VELTEGFYRKVFPGFARFNIIIVFSLGYLLSVFNKHSTLKAIHTGKFDAIPTIKFSINIY